MVKRLFQRWAARLAVVAMFGAGVLVPAPAPAGQGESRSAADLIAALQPTVVNITTVTHAKAGPAEGNMSGQPMVTDHSDQSSGFFVAASGIIVTNRHAIATASEIVVTLFDTTKLKACVLAVATQNDIALLQVNPGKPVTPVAFGDSDATHPGDPVFLIGNALGLGSTVTAGIVSALDRTTEQSGFGSFLQIDAALNHGNSGGPVFNAAGELVGVATALLSPGSETGSVGLGLAIPSRDAKLVIERLLQHGELQLGWIGAQIQPVTADIAAAVKLPSATGSIVTDVDEDSPALHAGLSAGDVILKIVDDDGSGPRSLNRIVARSAAGTILELVVWRNGTQQTMPIVVGEPPAEPATAKRSEAACATSRTIRPDLGLLLGPITADIRRKLGLGPHETGVQVTDVVANTVAADRGMTAGSLVVKVQRRSVTAPMDVQAGIDAARAANEKFVLMLVRDSQGRRWVALPLDSIL